jgi:hypothetical protein
MKKISIAQAKLHVDGPIFRRSRSLQIFLSPPRSLLNEFQFERAPVRWKKKIHSSAWNRRSWA